MSRLPNAEIPENKGLLDLADLVLDNILSKLPAQALSKVATACKEFHAKCTTDYLWEHHVESKWKKVVGSDAFLKWKSRFPPHSDQKSICKTLGSHFSHLSTSSCTRPCLNAIETPVNAGIYIRWYAALETGVVSFSAQVYNRENGHVGFILSCYDAEVSYDRITDTFTARYPPHGSWAVVTEDGIQWERLRCPPIATPAHTLHLSGCLYDLRPGDHVEVQWRKNKHFPYGWWYGTVGHLANCGGDSQFCRCDADGTVWLEFNQYCLGSRWRRAAVNRATHREAGNEAQGFYAGIRKICSKEEILTWKQLWPKENLD